MVTTMLTTVSRSGKTSCWTRVPATNWPVAARRMSTRKGIVPRPCAKRAKTTKDGWMCGYPPCGRMESKIPIRSVFPEVNPRCPSQRYSDFATGRITPALNCHPLSDRVFSEASEGESKGTPTHFKTNHRRGNPTTYFFPFESTHRFLHRRADSSPSLASALRNRPLVGGRFHSTSVHGPHAVPHRAAPPPHVHPPEPGPHHP